MPNLDGKSKSHMKDQPLCTHCGILGHTKDKCYKLHGYPPSYKKLKHQCQSGNVNQIFNNSVAEFSLQLSTQRCPCFSLKHTGLCLIFLVPYKFLLAKLSLPHKLVVNRLSQFMSDPWTPHLLVVSSLVEVLKCITRPQGLLFPFASSLNLTAFADADWGSCPDTRLLCVFG